MPDSPAHNPMTATPTAPPIDSDIAAGKTIAFLPPLISRVLIACWILLFSTRWLIVQGMIVTGFFGPDSPLNLDRIDKIERIDASMGRCYLLLLSVTLVIFILRIVRGLSPSPGEFTGPKTDFSAQQRGGASAGDAVVEAGASDQGGK